MYGKRDRDIEDIYSDYENDELEQSKEESEYDEDEDEDIVIDDVDNPDANEFKQDINMSIDSDDMKNCVVYETEEPLPEIMEDTLSQFPSLEENEKDEYETVVGLLACIQDGPSDNMEINKMTRYKKGLPFLKGDTTVDNVNIIDAEALYLKLNQISKPPEEQSQYEKWSKQKANKAVPALATAIVKVRNLAAQYGIGEFHDGTHPLIIQEETDLITRWIDDGIGDMDILECPLCKYKIDPIDPQNNGGTQMSKQISSFWQLFTEGIRGTGVVKTFTVMAGFWNKCIRDAYAEYGVHIEGLNKSIIEWHFYHTPRLKRLLDNFRLEKCTYLALDTIQRNGLFGLDANGVRCVGIKNSQNYIRLLKAYTEAVDRTSAVEMAMFMTNGIEATEGATTLKSAIKSLDNKTKTDRFGIRGGNALANMIENKHGVKDEKE